MKVKVSLLFMFLLLTWGGEAQDEHNFTIGGVRLGVITYSYRWMPEATIPAIVKQVLASGVNSIELMGFPVEEYAGIPGKTTLKPFKKKGNVEAKKKYDKVRKMQHDWRVSVSMDKFKEIRKIFNEAGIKIDILKLGFPDFWTDEELDYAFRVAKTLGASGLTMEISEKAAQRMAPLAKKHDMYVIFHNHLQPKDPDFSFDKVLACGDHVMLNFDIGHYVKATGKNPVDFIEKYHDRIVSIHLKDRTGPNTSFGEPDLPFGQGETPLTDVLLTIKKKYRNILCHIEIEYQPGNDSDSVKEVRKSVNFCQGILEN